MANSNYPQELEDLIQEYLTDGIISARERSVLLNKAQQLGLNVDEIDLYIDAQQQKADQEIEAAVRKQRGSSCPYCGGSVPLLADKCPHCEKFITVEATQELKEILNALEDALVEFKSEWRTARNKAKVERYLRKANLYYGNNPKIQNLLAEIDKEFKRIDKEFKRNEKNQKISELEKPEGLDFFVAGTFGAIFGAILGFVKSCIWNFDYSFWSGIGSFFISIPLGLIIGALLFMLLYYLWYEFKILKIKYFN